MRRWQRQKKGLEFHGGLRSEGPRSPCRSPSVPHSPYVSMRKMLLNCLAYCPSFFISSEVSSSADVKSVLVLHHYSLCVFSGRPHPLRTRPPHLCTGGCHITDFQIHISGFLYLPCLSVSKKPRNVQNKTQHLPLHACFISFTSYISLWFC